jgi:hypothetical protein
MIAPAGTAPGRRAPAARRPARRRLSAAGAGEAEARPWRLLVLACLALGGVSLLLASEPTYDPWAWIIWGREIVEWDLVTETGPSWKPLPVLFTGPFALLGDSLAPALWLVVARAGGLLAVAMAYRLASGIAGRVAGVIAALALLFSDEFVRNFARGNSEGLLVALCLWAVERHLAGQRRDAFLLGLGAALLRPEVWPFFGLYGLWLAWREPWRRPLVLAAFGATCALWFVPEYLGSGNFLRAAERAREVNPDSAAYAKHPFVEVFRRSWGILMLPVLAGAAAAGLLAVRPRGREPAAALVLALAAVAAILMVAVGLMTEAGFAGNLRYVSLPAALLCVLAGAGWVWLVRAASARGGRTAGAAFAMVVLAATVPSALETARDFRTAMERVGDEAALYEELDVAIARSGGRGAADGCGAVYTGDFQVPHLAWRLHRHVDDVLPGLAVAPAMIYSPRELRTWRVPGFTAVTVTDSWHVGRRCTT